MVGHRRHDEGNQAVALLATAIVVTVGVLFCGVTLLLFSQNANQTGVIFLGGLLACACLIWLLRDRRGTGTLAERYGALIGRKPKKEKVKVRIKRAKNSPDVHQPPTGPPTAEQIREISAGANCWVPSERQNPATDKDQGR